LCEPLVFGPVPPCRRISSHFVTNWRSSKRTRRVACASAAAIGSCGVMLYRLWSGWRRCLHMVQPDMVLRWHRRAFAWHWTRKSRRLPGRPEIAANIRDLIRRMRQANPLWGAPRIHGELLKLGIAVAQSTVAKCLPRPRKPPSQTWRTFLTNQLAQTTAIDFFTVPTATFRVLFVFVALSHERRRVVHFGVTEYPHAGVDHAADAGSVSLGPRAAICAARSRRHLRDRKSTRLNSSHQIISYAVFCLK